MHLALLLTNLCAFIASDDMVVGRVVDDNELTAACVCNHDCTRANETLIVIADNSGAFAKDADPHGNGQRGGNFRAGED